jgi:hypothetical protein
MYKKNFVATIKCNGQILREKDGIVNLPFDSEYSIFIKNLNSRDAQVSITADSKDVGNKLLVRAGKTAELYGFFNGSIVKNKFRFIKKTKQIMEHRGDDISDGIVTIEYTFVKKIVTERVETEYVDRHYYDNGVRIYTSLYRPTITNSGNPTCDFVEFNSIRGICPDSSINCCHTVGNGMNVNNNQLGRITLDHAYNNQPTPNSEEGITVRGSRCNQQFHEAFIGELEECSSMITLKLCGYTGEDKAEICKPITVKTKIECPTCGVVSRSDVKFCSNCGTFLI